MLRHQKPYGWVPREALPASTSPDGVLHIVITCKLAIMRLRGFYRPSSG